ncbi:MAG: hypothetical protein R3B48_30975, partial [Kofleriaceae bacterium]
LDSTNLTVDPKLNAELRLTADSPLIDLGIAGPIPSLGGGVLQPPERDIDGDSRAITGIPGNPALPDIGADEYRPPTGQR